MSVYTILQSVCHKNGDVEVIDFSYDPINRLTVSCKYVTAVDSANSITKRDSYYYDNAGNRFIKKSDDGNATVYLRHGQISVAMDVEIPKNDETEYVAKLNRYIASGDLVSGRITKIFKSDNETETKKYYYHLDHLNSTKVVTNEDAKVDVRYIYRAFGEQFKKLGEGDAKYSYGGKELDDTALYYFENMDVFISEQAGCRISSDEMLDIMMQL